jgi:signal transduction histidine kinase
MITRSLYVCNDHMERFLLDDRATSVGEARSVLINDTSEIRSELRGYPQDRQPEEARLLAQIDRDFSEEEQAFSKALSWTQEERRKQGSVLLLEQIIPRSAKLFQVSEEIVALSDRQSSEEDGAVLSGFRHARSKLAWTLAAMLLLGLALSCGCAFYILRLQLLERSRYQELTKHRHELQELSARLVDVQEKERRSISRELHDEVGQSLEALLVDAGRLSKLVPAESTIVQEQIARIKSVTENAVNTVRNIALLLRPSMLDDLGLTSALEWQAREISRRSEMEVDVQSDGVSDDLDDERKICIYRLAQEALNNAAKHSLAANATVRVAQTADRISIEVADNGKGFDLQRVRGVGLLGMEERVKRLGGTLIIVSRPGSGTSIKAELPLNVSHSLRIA